MFCLRCTSRLVAPRTTVTQSLRLSSPLRQQLPSLSTTHNQNQQTHPFSLLSNRTIRPTLRTQCLETPTTETPSSSTSTISSSLGGSTSTLTSATSLVSTSVSALQVRGAKRDTYDPSHFVRKRRHGFLSRLRSRTGRKTLKRRQLKGRTTLSH